IQRRSLLIDCKWLAADRGGVTGAALEGDLDRIVGVRLVTEQEGDSRLTIGVGKRLHPLRAQAKGERLSAQFTSANQTGGEGHLANKRTGSRRTLEDKARCLRRWLAPNRR